MNAAITEAGGGSVRVPLANLVGDEGAGFR
jgi:hypothetical protein